MFRGHEIHTIEEAAELGGVLELAHDQNGCRFLQDQLELRKPSHSDIDIVYSAVLHDAVLQSMDPFGNYLIQKLVQYGTDEQRSSLLEACRDQLVNIALNVHGTRVVQKMVECASTPEQIEAVCTAIDSQVMELIRDMNGNHVMQRCLASMPIAHSSFIFQRVTSECLETATHRHGCCVLQRCLDYADEAHRALLIAEVIRHAPKLVVDPFGNYVVQYILDLKQPPLTQAVVHALHGSLSELSLQKFSSNVIERCLNSGDPTVVSILAQELLQARNLGTLLHDPFANYVMQTLVTVASDIDIQLFVVKAQPHLSSLRNTLYGKRIQAKLTRRCPKLMR